MPTVSNGQLLVPVSGGMQVIQVANGNILHGDNQSGIFVFATAGVEFTVGADGVVSLTILRGTIQSSTYSNGFNFGAVSHDTPRENKITVLVPNEFSNAGMMVTMTLTTTQPQASVPGVTTVQSLGIGNNVTLVGRIDSSGLPVTGSGFYFAEGELTSISGLISLGTHLIDGTTSGTFSEDTGVINYDSRYSFVAYAENSVGRGYGEILYFDTASEALLLGDILVNQSIADDGTVTITTNGRGRIDSIGITAGSQVTVSSVGNSYSAQIYGRANSRTPRVVWVVYTITDSDATNNGMQLGPVNIIVTQEASLVNVSTTSAHQITTNSASLRGAINDAIGAAATSAGFYHGTDPNPIINGTKVTTEEFSGLIDYPLSGLTQDTDYYFAVWGANQHGESVGAILSFSTNPLTIEAPEVSNFTISDVGPNEATLSAVAMPADQVIESTFFYGTDPDFGDFNFQLGVFENAIKIAGKLPETDGSFQEVLNGLNQNTTYYVRAGASSAGGWDISEEMSFTTQAALDVRINAPNDVLDLGNVFTFDAELANPDANAQFSWESFQVIGTQTGNITIFNPTSQSTQVFTQGEGSIGLRVTATSGAQTSVDEITLFIINTGGPGSF